MSNNLGQIRQYLGEQSEGKMYSAKELWEIFDTFQPLMTKEQKEQLIDHLNISDRIENRISDEN